MTTPTKCQRCGKTFKGGDKNTACAVMHQAGDCCHYGQTEVHQLPNEPDKSQIVNYVLTCPACGSDDIDMIGDPEFNDEWVCEKCKETFGRPKQIEVLTPTQPDSTTECQNCKGRGWTQRDSHSSEMGCLECYGTGLVAAQPSPSLDELKRTIAHILDVNVDTVVQGYGDPVLASKWRIPMITEQVLQAITALIEAEKLSEYERGEAAGLKYGLVTLTETVRALQDQHNETIAKLHALQDEHKEEV